MPSNSNIPCEYIWQAFNRLCPLIERNLIRNRLIKEFCGIATDDEKKQNHKKFPPQVLHQRCGRPPVVETASRYRSNVNRLAMQLYNAALQKSSGAFDKDKGIEEHSSSSEDEYEKDDEKMEKELRSSKDKCMDQEQMEIDEGKEDSLETVEGNEDGLKGTSCVWIISSETGEEMAVPLWEKWFNALAPVPDSAKEDQKAYGRYWPRCLFICLVLQACASRHLLSSSFEKVNTLPGCFWDGWNIVGKGTKRKYVRQKCTYHGDQKISPSMLQSVFGEPGTPFIMLVRSDSHANLVKFVWNGSKLAATWYSTYGWPMHEKYKAQIEKDLYEASRQEGVSGDFVVEWTNAQLPLQTNKWDCVIYTSVLADRLSRDEGYEDLNESTVASYRPRLSAFLLALGFSKERTTLDDFE